MRTLFFLLALLPLMSFAAQNDVNILPAAQSYQKQTGTITLDGVITVYASKKCKNEVEMLKQYLSDDFQIQTKEGSNKSALLNLILDKSMKGPEHAYSLEADKKITIKSATTTGLFYGIQTLRQLIQKDNNQCFVAKAAVYDYPAFSWRAFMLDEGRYFKGKKVVFQMLDEMARLKMNVFHWHLTDDQGWRLEIKKYPKLTEVGAFRDSSEINHFHSNLYDGKPHGGFYTQKEIKEILEYASKRHINVVPEIEMPGHASAAIASYSWLGTKNTPIKVPCNFGVHYNVFNVADPKVVSFMEDVLSEVIALFPSQVIHIGGDEVKYDEWKASQVVKAYMEQNNLKTPAELQIYFTNNMSNWLSSKNRRMMGWNEITGDKIHDYQINDNQVTSKQKLAPNTIVQFWQGDPKLIVETIKKGYDVINSYHSFTYLDYNFDLKTAYSFNPIPEGLTEDQRAHVLGIGCQMWGEFIPTEESMYKKVFPRLAAYAEVGWTLNDKKDYNRFQKEVSKYYRNK